MPKKKKKKKKQDNEYDIDDEIIIGYNTNNKKDKPPKTDKKPKKKKKQKKKKKKKGYLIKILKVLLKIIIVLAIAAGVIVFLFVSPVFNIEHIEVTGAKEIGESVYIAMSEIEIGSNIFEIDKTSIIEAIKKEPYVETVEIKSIYPNKIEINVTERTVSYVTEYDGRYFYLDKNGYLLETSLSLLEMPVIKGCTTELGNMELGERIKDEDLSKFNDLIKIMDALQNNSISAKLTSIDISDDSNYILEFAEEGKNIMLGEASDLSAKMAWINLFIKEKKEQSGIIYLNTDEVYFSLNS